MATNLTNNAIEPASRNQLRKQSLARKRRDQYKVTKLVADIAKLAAKDEEEYSKSWWGTNRWWSGSSSKFQAESAEKIKELLALVDQKDKEMKVLDIVKRVREKLREQKKLGEEDVRKYAAMVRLTAVRLYKEEVLGQEN